MPNVVQNSNISELSIFLFDEFRINYRMYRIWLWRSFVQYQGEQGAKAVSESSDFSRKLSCQVFLLLWPRLEPRSFCENGYVHSIIKWAFGSSVGHISHALASTAYWHPPITQEICKYFNPWTQLPAFVHLLSGSLSFSFKWTFHASAVQNCVIVE